MSRSLFPRSVQLFAGLLLALQLMPLATSGAPQSRPRPGKIKGLVFDINKARVVNARVIVDGAEIHRTLVTDDKGEFEISLIPGVYQISVDANGFRRFMSAATEVKAGKTKAIKIQLMEASAVMLVPATAGSD
jgi:uncharacterized membrane protein